MMKIKLMGALSAFVLSASVATAGSLTDPVVEAEPENDPFAVAPAAGSLGGNAGMIAAGVVLMGLVLAASDGS